MKRGMIIRAGLLVTVMSYGCGTNQYTVPTRTTANDVKSVEDTTGSGNTSGAVPVITPPDNNPADGTSVPPPTEPQIPPTVPEDTIPPIIPPPVDMPTGPCGPNPCKPVPVTDGPCGLTPCAPPTNSTRP